MSVSTYAKHFSTKKTPQSQPIPGSNQVPNSAGGFAWAVDDWKRLDRFLVLGSEGGSYYATEQKLTVENAQAVLRCLQADPLRTVSRIVEISDSGRAPKNDPAIFALALACGQKNKPKLDTFDKAIVDKAIHDAIPKVCRIGTHIFSFVEAVQNFRGWGRGLRDSIAYWYNEKNPKDLAFQVTKYQQRNGWSHRDLLRLSHAHAATPSTQEIFHWIVKGWEGIGDDPHTNPDLMPIWAMEKAKRSKDAKEIVRLIRDYGLVREHIPTNFLNDVSVWEALLEKMPMTAMIRNLATMTRAGLLAPMSNGTAKVISELGNSERLKKSRIHPIAVLSALLTYQQGHGERGHNTWSPVSQIVDALDRAFYLSFGNVEATGKRWMLALDVSGSMGMGPTCAGVPGLYPRVASGALALITAAVEPLHTFVAFTNGGWGVRKGQWSGMGYNNGITPLSISPRQRLDDVCKQVAALPMGGTDCALPMLYAADQKIPIDVFVVLTDSETWSGTPHPSQALVDYRNKLGINSKLITVGMVSNGFTIADPNDSGQLDVIGFDSATPQLMSSFAKGEL